MSLHAAGDGGVHPSSSRALGDARQQRHERRLVVAGQGAAGMASQLPQYVVPYSCSLTYALLGADAEFARTVDKLWSPRLSSPSPRLLYSTYLIPTRRACHTHPAVLPPPDPYTPWRRPLSQSRRHTRKAHLATQRAHHCFTAPAGPPPRWSTVQNRTVRGNGREAGFGFRTCCRFHSQQVCNRVCFMHPSAARDRIDISALVPDDRADDCK